MTFLRTNSASSAFTENSKNTKRALNTRMMHLNNRKNVECWTRDALNCRRVNYVAKGEGLADSEYEWQISLYNSHATWLSI